MADPDQASSSQPQILPSDLELIDSFIRGQKKSIAAAHLQIEYAINTVKLLDRQKNIVGVSKQVNEWQQKILLHRHSIYLGAVQERLILSGFFAAAGRSHPDFLEYQKYQIPNGYQIFYRPASSLGQAWLNSHAKDTSQQSNKILIFQDSNWYPIQELHIHQQTMRLRTLVGEIAIGIDDFMVWIQKNPAVVASIPPSDPNTHPPMPSVVPAPSLFPPKAKEMSIPSEDPSKSTELTAAFKTPVVTGGHKPTEEALDNLKNAIKMKALGKLMDYLESGEKIVSTEILKSANNQVISTKTTEIKRNCPRWVIEQIKKF